MNACARDKENRHITDIMNTCSMSAICRYPICVNVEHQYDNDTRDYIFTSVFQLISGVDLFGVSCMCSCFIERNMVPLNSICENF